MYPCNTSPARPLFITNFLSCYKVYLPFEEQVLCNYVQETNIFIPFLVNKRRAFLLVIQLFASKKLMREVTEPNPVQRASLE